MTGFVFFESFYEMLQEMPEEMSFRFYRYICEYGLYGTEPELKEGVERALWIPIKLSIDSMQSKSNRGRPRKQSTETESVENETQEIQQPPIQEQNENETESAPEKPTKKSKATTFKKPTIDEIKAYIGANNYSVDSDKFYNYYESNGWRVGKSPMKNWQAAVRNWESNSYSRKSPEMTDNDTNKYLKIFEKRKL